MKKLLVLFVAVGIFASPGVHAAQTTGCEANVHLYYEPTLIGFSAATCAVEEFWGIATDDAVALESDIFLIPPGSVAVSAVKFDFTRSGSGNVWGFEMSGLASQAQTTITEEDTSDDLGPSAQVSSGWYEIDPTALGVVNVHFWRGDQSYRVTGATVDGLPGQL